MNERDTHFLGFAHALLNELFDVHEGSLILGRDLYPQDNEKVAQHIAQRAYDLVFNHVLVYLREGANIPDMTALSAE